MDREFVVGGFPRSGNMYLYSVLQTHFPTVSFVEKVGHISSLKLTNSIVPIRNPYESVPSWSVFGQEKNLENIALWNLRFLKSILFYNKSLIIVDFNVLIKDYKTSVNQIAKVINQIPVNPTNARFDINSNISSYNYYESSTMKKCFTVYKDILKLI
jgi:hypothetical protein